MFTVPGARYRYYAGPVRYRTDNRLIAGAIYLLVDVEPRETCLVAGVMVRRSSYSRIQTIHGERLAFGHMGILGKRITPPSWRPCEVFTQIHLCTQTATPFKHAES
jgi:hypothetical protein